MLKQSSHQISKVKPKMITLGQSKVINENNDNSKNQNLEQ